MMKRRPAARFPVWLLGWLVVGPLAGADLDSRSLTLRTALHQDASLEAPFAELWTLYREADREADLVRLYQTHLAQYPADQGARAVHLRLLLAANAPEAAAAAAEALRLHPENPYLHYLAFRATGELEPLSRAIALETKGDRRGPWLRELLESAVREPERTLASRCLVEERDRRLANAGEGLPELLQWMAESGHLDVARATLALADKAALAPEVELELALQSVRVEAPEASAQRLASLLQRLAADHPRRADLVRARRSLVSLATDLLAQAREAVRVDPLSAAAAADLATLLEAEGDLTGAGQVWAEAALRLPHLAWLEERARPLLESEPQPVKWRDYLKRRLPLKPERPGLGTELIFLTFSLDGPDAGKKAVEAEVARGSAAALAELGTGLMARGFPEGAVIAFRGAQRTAPKGFELGEGLVRARVALGDADAVATAVRELSVTGVPVESWTRLASFLEAEDFAAEARELLERGLASQPGSFAATLALAKVAAAERGEELLEQSRLLIKDEDSYRDWLIAAVEFFAGQGRAESFWSGEEARLSAFADGIGADAVRRVNSFVGVASERSQENRGRRVAARLLERAGAETGSRPDLQRLAATVFAGDPSRAPEVERHLLALLDAAKGASAELRLRLALLYHLVARPDLAEPQLARIDWSEIDVVSLLDEAVSAFPEQRTRLWQRLAALRPADPETWEEWLNALWREGRTEEFRSAAGKLVAEDSPLNLSAPVRTAISERIEMAWQQEIDADLRRGEPEVALRKVRLLARESGSDWVRWIGAMLLEQTGRKEEAEAWWAQLHGEEAKARRALRNDPQAAPPPAPSRLAPLQRIAWRFQPLPGARIANLAALGTTVAILDDRNHLHAVDCGTGKLLWEADLHGEFSRLHPGDSGRQGELVIAPDLVADAGTFFVPAGDRVVALKASSGQTVWEARGSSKARLGLAGPDLLVVLAPATASLSAFDRHNGKLRWTRALDSGIANLPAEAIGFASAGRAVAVWTDRLTVCRAVTGEPLWTRRLGDLGPLDLDGTASAPPAMGRRHLAFHGDHVIAMESGQVTRLGVEFPGMDQAKISGIHLGGDAGRVCFQTDLGVEVWEPGTGRRSLLPGTHEAILVAGHSVLQSGSGRLAGLDFRTGRKLWETAWTSDLPVPSSASPGSSAWWRGPITEERWQGVLIRRSRPHRAVVVAGGVVIAGETSVEAWMP